jgi:DNA-binding CsgD family transcriptional regulator/PAS domain-containing protein
MIGDDDSLFGLIYDGVTDEACWDLALAQVAGRVGAAGAGLGMQDMRTHSFRNLGAFGIDPDLGQTYLRLAPGNTIWQEIGRRRQPLTDTMVLPKAAFLRTELYADWFRPQGFHSVMAHPALFEESASAVVVAFREKQLGDFEPADLACLGRFASHFRRALSLRLDRERLAEALSSADRMLDQLGDGVLLIDRALRLRHANAPATAMLEARMAIWLHSGRLELRDPRAHAKLARLAAEGRGGDLRLAPPGFDGFVIRLRPCADGFAGAMIVTITDPRARREPPTPVRLRNRFGLSGRQAEAIAELANGATEAEAAQRLGLATPTLHIHVRRAYEKLDLRSRAELSALLARHGFETGRSPK